MNIKKINEFYTDRKSNNKIQLLVEYKMMNDNWSAWTEDSYCSTLFQLSDDEISEFLNKDYSELEEIQYLVNKYYEEKVK